MKTKKQSKQSSSRNKKGVYGSPIRNYASVHAPLQGASVSANLQVARFEKILLLFYGIYNTPLIFLSILNTPDDKSKTTYYVIQGIFIVVAWIFNIIRRKKRYYIAALSEMNEKLYFQLVLLTLLAVKALYRSFNPELGISQLGDATVTIVITVLLLTLYQRYNWAIETRRSREEVIKELFKKANLSKDEAVAVESHLIAEAERIQETPKTWRVFQFILATMIVGTTISTYSQQMAQFIQQFLPLRDYLLP